MKRLLFIALLLSYGCTPKIHELFEANKYISNFNLHVVNDSLQLYFKSPADIAYTSNERDLKKLIRKSKFKVHGRVLAHGITDQPPYEFFVTISAAAHPPYPAELVVFDTLIHNQKLEFIGNPLAKNAERALGIDLNNIFKSLVVGEAYRKEINTATDGLH